MLPRLDQWIESAVLGRLPRGQQRALTALLALGTAAAVAAALTCPASASLLLLAPPVVVCFFRGIFLRFCLIPLLALHHLLVGSLLADLWFAVGLAAGMTFSVVTVRKYREARRASDDLLNSLEVARQMQRGLEPPTTQQWGPLDMASYLQTSDMLGGDFLCMRPVGPDRFGILLGDVMGKGVRASLAAAFMTGLYGELAREGFGPGAILEIANRRLYDVFSRFNLFVTMAALEYDPKTDDWRLALAGHEAPVLVRPGTSSREVGEAGLAAGIEPDTSYPEVRFPALPGDQVFIASDGLLPHGPDPEAVGPVLAGSAELPVDTTLERVVLRLRPMLLPEHPDDVTAVLVRR